MRVSVIAVPVLIITALAVSLFFVGTNIVIFGIVLGLLITGMAIVLWRAHGATISIPRSMLAASLTLFWLWLAVTLLWTPVSFVSTTMFWWLSALPLGFWLYTLQPVRIRAWPQLAMLALIAGYGLVLTGIFQRLAKGEMPQSAFLDINIQAAVLMFMALPAGGYMLRMGAAQRAEGQSVAGAGTRKSDRRRDARLAALLGFSFLLLVYGLMLTRSRGGILAFFVGTVALFVMTVRHVPKKWLAIYAGLVVLAFLLADISWGGALLGRMADTFQDIHRASSGRFVIWRESWRLLFEQSPLWGIGLGLYSLVWPPYRAPEDASGGYFVHNDYLQIWIESGLPGLLLLLAVLVSVAWMVWRTLHRNDLPRTVRIEIAGLSAGLLAIAAHSFVQYNFYVIPILLLSGLLLARLQELAVPPRGTAARAWRWRPNKHLSAAGYRLIVLALTLLPLGYFSSIGISAYQLSRGDMFAARHLFDEADQAFMTAQRFWPDSDAPLIARAGLYRVVLARGGKDVEQQKALFQRGETLLVQAERLNPLRPDIFALRAELYRQAPLLAGSGWDTKAAENYRHALTLNPRHYRTRLRYAQFLFDQDRKQEASNIVGDGARYR